MNIYTIIQLVNTLFNFYSTLIVVYCLLTWIPMKRGGLLEDIAVVLDGVCGPWLNPTHGRCRFLARGCDNCVAVCPKAGSSAARYDLIGILA